MNFVFKPVGPHVDLCTMQFLILCLTYTHCLRQARTSDTHSKQACYLPAANWLLHIPHVSQPSAPMRYPETKRQHWSRFQYNSPQNVESLEVWKLQHVALEQSPGKIQWVFFQKSHDWGGELKILTWNRPQLSSPGHWSRRFIQHCLS